MHPIILFALFFFFAVAYNLLGPLATNIMETTGLSLSDSGSLVSLQQIGALVSMGASVILMKKLKQTTVARFGYLFIILALSVIAFSTSSFMLFACYLVLGVGSFLADSGSNAAMAGDYYEKRALYVPLLHFCYSAGAIATGYITLPFKGTNWPWAYGTIGIVLAVIMIVGMVEQQVGKRRRADTTIKKVIRDQQVQAGPLLPIFKDKAYVLYTLVMMLYMGSQIICSAWIPVYVETELAQSATMTATSLTVFWIGTALSRLIAGPVMNKGAKPFTLSIWGIALAGFSLVGVTLSSNIVLVLAFTMLCGFFAGATIPMYIVITSTWYPKNTAFISLSYLFAGAIGRMIFPWLVTVIGAVTSLGFGLLLSSSMLFLAAILIAWVRRMTVERPAY